MLVVCRPSSIVVAEGRVDNKVHQDDAKLDTAEAQCRSTMQQLASIDNVVEEPEGCNFSGPRSSLMITARKARLLRRAGGKGRDPFIAFVYFAV